ncbi:P-loop containing nucleoside triphosphate hydrolase [Raphidocelis subcapitata]|uniref:P-loop containing nucleoside triphosphate hydrolase n=1 Tax=Raphidocelis subcapitata TaxID=307507 RepID=A0A2V0P5B4_9CHLO|nr:P-loop containing nucleoside triphosphate hydrolase [Raphidocelis subcapitata]|eukprot:GBF95048.1 P-loop containing nucleoside triphosphate hydrolase [Raphidocelis subcapitata]
MGSSYDFRIRRFLGDVWGGGAAHSGAPRAAAVAAAGAAAPPVLELTLSADDESGGGPSFPVGAACRAPSSPRLSGAQPHAPASTPVRASLVRDPFAEAMEQERLLQHRRSQQQQQPRRASQQQQPQPQQQGQPAARHHQHSASGGQQQQQQQPEQARRQTAGEPETPVFQLLSQENDYDADELEYIKAEADYIRRNQDSAGYSPRHLFSSEAAKQRAKRDLSQAAAAAAAAAAAGAPGGAADGSFLSEGHAGMDVVFKGLSYRVYDAGVKKRLLQDITGHFEPQQLSALMGPSGSGKTTLLDLLAGRKTTGKAKGDILFAGNRPTRPFLRRYTGYVEQFDTLLPILTVEEMLMYTAELKRPRRESRATKRAAVEELLEKLALTSCRAVKIGNPLEKGISGGQSKRTNIGIALITNPRVLMLDEPTSGLDSFTANEVISLLKGITAEGVTVIATIHSPTAYAFSLFDRLMMLVAGRVVYLGPSGAPALDFVRGLPVSTVASPYQAYNEVEWLVDLFTLADRLGEAAAFADAYEVSELCASTRQRVEELSRRGRRARSAATASELAVRHATNTPWWWGLLVLLRYRTVHNYTNPAFLAARLADKAAMGATIMTLYWGIGGRFAFDNFFNVSAVLFMSCMIPAFGASAFVPSLVLERRLFVRERHDGLYRVATYLAAKMLDELGVAAVGSVGMSAIVYFGVGLQGSFLVFWLTYFATLCVGIALAYTIAALSPSMDIANAALPTYVGSLAFVSGFLIRFDDMPAPWRWYSRANPLAYAFTALMNNQFGAVNPKFIGGHTLLEYFGVAGQSIWLNIGIVWGFFGAFVVATWLVLSLRRYDRR